MLIAIVKLEVVAVVPLVSVTLTVIAAEPAVVGVPVIAPELGFKLKPAGNVPEFNAKTHEVPQVTPPVVNDNENANPT